MADYVRNLWYMAAWDHEIPDGGMLSRTLLGEKWLIASLSDGTYAMLADSCPHRFVPLSKGKLEADVIHCPYHGLGFDRTGTCVHSPFPGPPPAHVRARTMPVILRHRALWFWPGDPNKADARLIPDFGFVDRDGMQRSHLVIQGHYELVTDNLMDLTHIEFLHVESFGVNGSIFAGRQSVVTDESGAIWNNWDMEAVPAPAWAAPMVADGARVDQWLYMRWHAPAAMALTVGLSRTGTERRDMVVPEMVNPHIITPETSTSSHYFYDHEATREAEVLARKVFIEEDEPMIEAAQQSLGTRDFWDARPAILETDAGAIRARRRMMQLRRAEAADEAQVGN
ncbi:aromatic ring-hydroxylating dioxygenase subunit alpha [Novosphingobium mathurense]|uniref:Vanillate O-demethylase monooxygenase subunit n=1 Tax=Novosphingobium mathurense TaxID=428990 RepID=A0A1U6HWL0_9SPHN|nr:aromatic ring-hydroxylating dioxygenase subunit alpha [Novosphingobium mathurense]SLK00159.1 vanillate O-demethylase monooxygenase subunit [Novosphingobium mathurense]